MYYYLQVSYSIFQFSCTYIVLCEDVELYTLFLNGNDNKKLQNTLYFAVILCPITCGHGEICLDMYVVGTRRHSFYACAA